MSGFFFLELGVVFCKFCLDGIECDVVGMMLVMMDVECNFWWLSIIFFDVCVCLYDGMCVGGVIVLF